MDGMSNTRKEIMERLGAFAGGAKSEMAADDVAYALYRKLNGSGTAITKQNYREWERLVGQAMRIKNFTPAGGGMSLHELAHDVAQEINEMISKSSRPGAKEEMARFINVASWSGQHGSTYEAMVTDDNGVFQPGIVLKSKDGGSQLLTRSAPNFKSEAGARKWLKDKIAQMKSGHSRPGAKVEFAKPTGRLLRGIQIPEGYFGVYERSDKPGQDAYAMWVTLKDGRMINLGSHPSLSGAINGIGHLLATGEKKVKDYTFSRPGAKSTHAAPTDGFYGEADAAKDCNECEAEDIKYGEKIKMATDPAVGRKISKLMDEGYPQQQAIAIALDMKRRGEI